MTASCAGATNSPDPSVWLNTIVDGLRNVLRLATAHIPMYYCDP
ncbi:MAG TPA: hypothetical protein VK701_06030 [Solirubrobacteraceae bacterium]|nr:hypothetical protein [Solirubrobacteraceae bacterium]